MASQQPDRPVLNQRGELGTPQRPGVDPHAPVLPPGTRPVGQPVSPVDWFRRMPGGGASTAFVRPATDDPTAVETEQD
jgi:hypothetical protein